MYFCYSLHFVFFFFWFFFIKNIIMRSSYSKTTTTTKCRHYINFRQQENNTNATLSVTACTDRITTAQPRNRAIAQSRNCTTGTATRQPTASRVHKQAARSVHLYRDYVKGESCIGKRRTTTERSGNQTLRGADEHLRINAACPTMIQY